MTRAYDIKQLIAEEASGPSDRRALEEMAERLDDALSADVPYRPEFKAQLRKRLMTQARQQLTPWYRRPAFLGSGMAVAAAAAVLFFGLNMWQEEIPNPVQPPAPTEIGAQEADPGKGAQPKYLFRVNEQVRDVPVLQLADEKLTALTPAQGAGGAANVTDLQLKRLTARPDAEEFRQLASRLAFRGESRRTSNGWSITEENRSLTLTDDGRVEFTNQAPANPAGEPIDAEGARRVALQFLDQALLPIPGIQPVVNPENGSFTVVYTEQVEGRPVVNARTIILVNPGGKVTRAEAYVASGVTTQGTYQAVTEAEAIAEAQARGGSFNRADLVWARTPGDGTVYLQPYWRVFGTDSGGDAVVRYVPALKR